MEENVTPLNPSADIATSGAVDTTKSQPHNIDAEQSLLGALLVNNNVQEQFSDFLQPMHFYDPVHQRIYEAASRLIANNNLASPTTLRTYLESDSGLQELGGAAYLAQLVSQATTLVNARQYARTVFELARRRALIQMGEEMIENARIVDIDEDTDQQIENVEAALYQLSERGSFGGDFVNFQTSITESIRFADHACAQIGKLSGLSTGLGELDEKLGGLQKSDLIILAGRPSMGKTALATNIAFHVAQAYQRAKLAQNYQTDSNGKTLMGAGGVVGFFSLEMSAGQLATRIIAEQANIFSFKIRKGDIDQTDYDKFVKVARDLENLPLYIDDTGALPIATLATRARRLKRQHGLDMIIVDYIQLMHGSAHKQDRGRVQEVGEITQGLKALAKELDVPVLALSQLSRQVESRDDKRPQLADLRDSGTIEQDADIVMFVYREAYYHARKRPAEGTDKHYIWQEEMNKINNVANVIIGKNRHGPIIDVTLKFEDKFTRFSDPDPVIVQSPTPDENDPFAT